mmetsp:Transcript_13224/g.26980  ORF Transcript_13224/g.26980 Transcript_13224/m.26980 type:complete len:462 (+) Transcript_13224:145-1530(+)
MFDAFRHVQLGFRSRDNLGIKSPAAGLLSSKNEGALYSVHDLPDLGCVNRRLTLLVQFNHSNAVVNQVAPACECVRFLNLERTPSLPDAIIPSRAHEVKASAEVTDNKASLLLDLWGFQCQARRIRVVELCLGRILVCGHDVDPCNPQFVEKLGWFQELLPQLLERLNLRFEELALAATLSSNLDSESRGLKGVVNLLLFVPACHDGGNAPLLEAQVCEGVLDDGKGANGNHVELEGASVWVVVGVGYSVRDPPVLHRVEPSDLGIFGKDETRSKLKGALYLGRDGTDDTIGIANRIVALVYFGALLGDLPHDPTGDFLGRGRKVYYVKLENPSQNEVLSSETGRNLAVGEVDSADCHLGASEWAGNVDPHVEVIKDERIVLEGLLLVEDPHSHLDVPRFLPKLDFLPLAVGSGNKIVIRVLDNVKSGFIQLSHAHLPKQRHKASHNLNLIGVEVEGGHHF